MILLIDFEPIKMRIIEATKEIKIRKIVVKCSILIILAFVIVIVN
jgi:hypothetical protein